MGCVGCFGKRRGSNLSKRKIHIIQDYVDGLGITMKEYKEQSKEISRKALRWHFKNFARYM